MKTKERIIVYIDGFNLYFGMTNREKTGIKWLNINKLVGHLLKDTQELVSIKYYTSSVNNNPEKQRRQIAYLEALVSTNVEIFYGQYQENIQTCKMCHRNWTSFKEKMTDVNIATAMLSDAFQDKYDAALLISADSDLVPPIREIHNQFKDKRVIVGFPPNRHSNSLSIESKGNFTIGMRNIKKSQFSDSVLSIEGVVLEKPMEW